MLIQCSVISKSQLIILHLSMCNQTIFSAYPREKRKKKKESELFFFSLEKISEFKAQELILPASYLIDLSAAMNLEERFAGDLIDLY